MNISPTLRHKGELTESEILSILPQFTSITPERTDEFATDIRTLMRDSNYNRFLTTLAGSFKQFLYNEFSELEEHYRDHLSLIGNLLCDIPGFRMDFSQQEVIYFFNRNTLLVFNLRGTAETALEKGKAMLQATDTNDNIDKIIGISFSAFDRKIDRWIETRI